jgi:hypothetical protein
VAESSRRGSVPLEGGSGRVAASSGAVLRLEAEVREGTVSVALERDEKHDAGGSTLLKGGRQDTAEGGQGVRRRVGQSGGERGGVTGRARRGPGMTARRGVDTWPRSTVHVV